MAINKKKTLLIIILGMLAAIGPFSIDMYLPAFSDIAKDLKTNVAHVTLSLSSFFIGISFGQFLYGPVLDRFGRKKPLYFGLIVYLLASIACAIVKDANMLIALRFIQAIGGCAGMVASRAMVRDIFPVEENAKVFSKLMLVIAISPIVAPTLGGYITHAFGWHFVFVTLALLGLIILLAVHFYLPESRKPDASFSLKPMPIIKGYFAVLKHPQFCVYAFVGAIAAAGLYAFIAGSPFVFMEIYKVSEKHYGWIFASIAFFLIVSSQINGFLLKTYSSQQIIKVALIFQSLSGLVLVFGVQFFGFGLWSIIINCCFILGFQGFTFPNSSALSMAPFTKNAGSASALMGVIQMAMGTLSTMLVSAFSTNTPVPIATIMMCCSIISLTILLIGRRVLKNNNLG